MVCDMDVAAASLRIIQSTKENSKRESSLATEKCHGVTEAGTKVNGGTAKCKDSEKKYAPTVVCDMKANGSRVSLFESDHVERIIFGCFPESIPSNANRNASEDYPSFISSRSFMCIELMHALISLYW